MSKTLVIQSHRTPLPYSWLEACLASVKYWCELNDYSYRFLDDALFEPLPVDLADKLQQQKVIASDLARLYALKTGLSQDYQTVIWLDADFLIFKPQAFVLPDVPYALGREVWVQNDKQAKLKVYKKVHNAFLMFQQGNGFLDFYLETAERLLRLNQGTMPPQYIGPKLLSAINNIARFPVMESAGMLSPMVVQAILKKGGAALDAFVENSSVNIAGANLCTSSCDRKEISHIEMEKLIDQLLEQKAII